MATKIEVAIDRVLCQGYANCLDAAPEVFDLDDKEIAIVITDDLDETHREMLERAADRCPARAITLHEIDGGN